MSPITGLAEADYVEHHEPLSVLRQPPRNPTHTRPTSVATIGFAGDEANHQYDINDFFSALSAENLPAVSSSRLRPIRTPIPATRIRSMNRPLW